MKVIGVLAGMHVIAQRRALRAAGHAARARICERPVRMAKKLNCNAKAAMLNVSVYVLLSSSQPVADFWAIMHNMFWELGVGWGERLSAHGDV